MRESCVNIYVNAIYYPNWRIYRNEPPSSLKLNIVTHVFYAFACVRRDGTVYLGDLWADCQIPVDETLGCLRSFSLLKQQYHGLKLILSIGGGGPGSEHFPEVAASPAARENFARSAKALVDEYNLNGIDVDWEHPANIEEGLNYIYLLAAVRDILPSTSYIVSSALPAGEWALRYINLGAAQHSLDFINIMAYDFSGPWVGSCGHQAQLYAPQNPHNEAAAISCESAVEYVQSQGVPAHKILLGVPVYGRSFLGAKSIGEPYTGLGGEEGIFDYKALPRPDTQEYVDEEAGAAFCIGGDGGFVSYDNPQTVRMKANFALDTGLAGLFFWTANYDPLDHLNAIFSHPSTLAAVPETLSALQIYQDELDQEIADLIAAQTRSDLGSVKQIQATKAELAELFQTIENVRERARQTEQAITDMTADIKRLDSTKKNLTLSMTALKRLQMLTNAYDQLRGLSKLRQYRDCAQLLQAVIQLMAHFRSYRSIDQIATLSRNVADLQRELLEQVCEDFEVTFAKSEVSQWRATLSEACLVMDALGENARSRLVTWYCNTQLREYRQIFRGNEEAGSLDNISRRYSWFKRMLKSYEDEHAAIFPPSWRVNEMLANAYCEGTRDDFKGILSRSMRRTDGHTLDVNLLLSCLQETLEFEQGLERRFANDSRASIDTLSSKDDKSPIFSRAISEAFEPYLSLWVESQDRELAALIPKYRQQELHPADEEFSSQSVIPSSTELFHFYRLTLAQCAKLSTGSRLVELSQTFAKYLDEYAQQVLLNFLRDRLNGQGPLLEDIIIVLNTAHYCHTTCAQLEEKVKSRIDEDLRSTIEFQSQEDTFVGIASTAVRLLVGKVETHCEPSWREMRNMPWSKLQSVGDQSSYVSELQQHISEKAAEILKLLNQQQYARAFCDNLVERLSLNYLVNLVQCRPITEIGAEQMLLDSYVLKKGYEELPTLGASPGTAVSPGFIKRVQQSTSKINALLKTLQVRSQPAEGLVQAYLIHIGDKSDTNFKKILELKGIRRADHPHFVELFQAHRASYESLIQASPFLTPIQLHPTSSFPVPGLGSGHSPSPSLQGRFDPSTLGSAIMSAARDGVERIGTPTLGVVSVSSSGAGAGAGAPGSGQESLGPAGNLNENLRNIGKFFKRDIAGFGGRFGRGSEEAAK
ncbi:MAG: Vacuolar protein sorting-associated protein 53 [Trizodia sp. TS-e1964]|nr:MAG: Vacuolar protein sorting-associated protein 53 [Trizodia sp. TS-e1964]